MPLKMYYTYSRPCVYSVRVQSINTEYLNVIILKFYYNILYLQVDNIKEIEIVLDYVEK